MAGGFLRPLVWPLPSAGPGVETTGQGIIVIIIIVIIIMMIMIALKGAILDFSQSPYCAANYLEHKCSSGWGAIVCKSHATHQPLIVCNISCAT